MAYHDPGDEVATARKKTPATLLLLLVLVLGAGALGMALSGSASSFLLFALGLAVFVAPGFPLARLWFTGSQGLLTGAAIGYLLSSFVASGLYRWGLIGAPSVFGASLLLALGLWLGLTRRRADAPPSGESNDRRWLVATLVLAMMLVALPFLRVGAQTAEGVAYRAYFSADLMTHLSVVGELQKGEFPPQNPFYSGRSLGYYWLFFLFPALAGNWIGNQEALLLTYLSGAFLFAGLAYSAARSLAASPRHAFFAVLAGLAAASFEGLAALARATWLQAPLGSFKNMNVDAFSRWVFELTSLDGLHRTLLYAPQHLFSYSLLLILVLLVMRGGPRGARLSLLSGALLGGMAGTSTVTAMLAGPWLVLVRLSRGGRLASLIRDLAVIGLVSLASLVWYFQLGFFGEAGASLALRRPQLLEIPALLILECGPLLLISIAALAMPRARPLGLLASMAFLIVLVVGTREYEGIWMAWRAGSVLLVCLMLMASVAMEKWRGRALACILLPASLTAILDIYNAQDIENRGKSAGEFRWTTIVNHAEVDALRWIRSETSNQAVVQWDTRARGPGEWALIPALGERRMAVGFPIFLLDLQKYRSRERRRVRPIFISEDPTEAYRLAVEAGIDYLFVGGREMEVRGERLRKLWESPELFEEAYSSRGVTVFHVVR